VQERVFHVRRQDRLLDRPLGSVIDQHAEDRIDYRREHEAAHAGLLRCRDHAHADFGFVGQEGGRDVEHRVDLSQCCVKACPIGELTNGNFRRTVLAHLLALLRDMDQAANSRAAFGKLRES